MEQKSMVSVSQQDVNDEIDLLELWEGLVQEKLTVILVVFFVTLLGGLFAFFSSKTYEVKAALLPPPQALINEANYRNIITLNSDEIFKKVVENLTPISLPEKLLKEENIVKLFKERSQNESLKILSKAISIEQPAFSKTGESIDDFLLTKISVLYENPEETLSIMESILALVNKEVRTEIKSELVSRLNLQLSNNQRSIELEIDKIKQEIDAEIKRLLTTDQEKKEAILEKIKTLRKRAEEDRLLKIQRLENDYALAEKLNIEKPTLPINFQKSSSFSRSMELVNTMPSNYWNGTQVLGAELNLLKKRENNDPYISELSGLNQQLEALKVNVKVEQLKSRTDFMSFSSELRALNYEKNQLLNALKTIEKADFPVYKMALTPILPVDAVKPKKALILVVSAVLGLMLGILIALIRRAIKNRKALQLDLT